MLIPPICRFFCGPDNRFLIQICEVAGGAYLLAVDMLILTILPGKMPIGILNALIGALLFGYLLRRSRSGLDGKHQATP